MASAAFFTDLCFVGLSICCTCTLCAIAFVCYGIFHSWSPSRTGSWL